SGWQRFIIQNLMVRKMYILNKNSEFFFYKLLSNSYFYKNQNNLFSDLFINFIKKYNKSLYLKKSTNIIVNKKPNIFNLLLLIKLIPNLWKIKYISERGFIYIDIKNIKTSFLHYKKVNIYSSNGIILPGLIIPNAKDQIKIDLGVENLNEVYELGINYNALIGLQDSLSIMNNNYLVSNQISSKIGLFILIEIISSLKTINFILYNNLNNKTLILKHQIQIIIILNRIQIIGRIFIKKENLEQILLYCSKNKIICYLKNLKINTYFINLKVKYLNTPNEMIKKTDLENLIQFVIWIFTRFDN
ncbi:MAG: hypothetical protein ACEOLT_00355, partial [Candidatus Karelsulcia muelleri]